MFKSLLPMAYLCVYLTLVSADGKADPLLVCPPNVGCIKGRFFRSYQKTAAFRAFFGIPYALPPVEELRFRSPQLMRKWDNVYNATEPKSDCIQKNYLLPTPIIYGQEDCLYLNVYAPTMTGLLHTVLWDTILHPVMVYIYGGGFFSGTAGPYVHGPDYFMDSGEVIVVTMGYRLGALGFLSTGDTHMRGNFGLKDQNLALKWVRDNIYYFGGDPNSVTIFGQSAGAVSTHLHVLSYSSWGLFHKVISQSGTANVPFAITLNPLEQARKTAELCNITNAAKMSTAELTNALRRVDVLTLINAGDGLKYWDVDPLTNFRPVVEPPGDDAFLTADPEYLMKYVNYPNVPWLIGTVPEEGAVRVINIKENTTLQEQFNSKFDELFEKLLEWPSQFSAQQRVEKTRIVLDLYFKAVHKLNDQTMQAFLDVITDRGFKHSLYKTILLDIYRYPRNAPFYMYSFKYKGPYSYASLYTAANVTGKYGVVHCDDLLYLFRSPLLFPDFPKDSHEAKLIQTLVRYFVSFAKYGYPSDEFPKLGRCSLDILKSQTDGVCDYHEFVNSEWSPSGFEVRVNNEYPTAKAKLWIDLLEESILSVHETGRGGPRG